MTESSCDSDADAADDDDADDDYDDAAAAADDADAADDDEVDFHCCYWNVNLCRSKTIHNCNFGLFGGVFRVLGSDALQRSDPKLPWLTNLPRHCKFIPDEDFFVLAEV